MLSIHCWANISSDEPNVELWQLVKQTEKPMTFDVKTHAYTVRSSNDTKSTPIPINQTNKAIWLLLQKLKPKSYVKTGCFWIALIVTFFNFSIVKIHFIPVWTKLLYNLLFSQKLFLILFGKSNYLTSKFRTEYNLFVSYFSYDLFIQTYQRKTREENKNNGVSFSNSPHSMKSSFHYA